MPSSPRRYYLDRKADAGSVPDSTSRAQGRAAADFGRSDFEAALKDGTCNERIKRWPAAICFRPNYRTKDALTGKRVGLLDLQVERAWKKQKRSFRLIVRVTERTIDKRGQHLLVPDIQIEGCWTTLTLPAEEVIEHYQDHGKHEQFRSEIKSDLDLERLPSGKFDTNDVILHLTAFAYNCLRLLGQWCLSGEIAPIRHPAKRIRLKTVLQEIMYRAAKFVAHARKCVLDFGRRFADHVKVFVVLQDRLLRAASP